MSKRNSDGDVVGNRFNLALAKQKSRLASMLGSAPISEESTNETEEQFNDEDLKQDHAYDRLGYGSVLPKDVADGSFTNRLPASDDRLLVQLLGAKKAKAHLAAKREAARPDASAKAKQYGKPVVVKKDESDEEEEGRAATFKSKRSRKTVERKLNSDDEDEETRAKRVGASVKAEEEKASKVSLQDVLVEGQPLEPGKIEPKQKEDEEEVVAAQVKTAPRKSKPKPKSFLDEILAERSKKKSKK